MFIKNLDFLSPSITFYYKGSLSHISILSGIISIITIVIIINYAIYFSFDIFKRKIYQSIFYRNFINDTGIVKLDPSSLFHFVNYAQIINGVLAYDIFDFAKFNIIGTNIYLNSYLDLGKEINNLDHWLYSYCEKDFNTDVELFSYSFYEKSACIKKFYNSSEGKYYTKGDPKFAWPEISYGTNNNTNKIYSLYVQKCNNKTIKNILGDDHNCKNDYEINTFFNISNPRIINLYFFNNYVNILNYKYPNNQFLYRSEISFKKDQIIQSDLTFDPVLVRSNDGYVFEHIRDDISYKFDRNDVYYQSNEGTNIYTGFGLFLTNTREYYERVYKNVPDLFSQLGGIFQVIKIIAMYINSFFNNYIVLADTEKTLHSLAHIEKNIHKKKLSKIKSSKIHMENIEKEKEIDKNNKKKIEKEELLDSKKNKIEINDTDKKNLSKSCNELINNIKEKNTNIGIMNSEIDNKINDKKNPHSVKEKNNINNFYYYFLYKIPFTQKKNNPFQFYDRFRMKIISEENVIKNHLTIFNLLKYNKKRRLRTNKYHLSDLLKYI